MGSGLCDSTVEGRRETMSHLSRTCRRAKRGLTGSGLVRQKGQSGVREHLGML